MTSPYPRIGRISIALLLLTAVLSPAVVADHTLTSDATGSDPAYCKTDTEAYERLCRYDAFLAALSGQETDDLRNLACDGDPTECSISDDDVEAVLQPLLSTSDNLLAFAHWLGQTILDLIHGRGGDALQDIHQIGDNGLEEVHGSGDAALNATDAATDDAYSKLSQKYWDGREPETAIEDVRNHLLARAQRTSEMVSPSSATAADPMAPKEIPGPSAEVTMDASSEGGGDDEAPDTPVLILHGYRPFMSKDTGKETFQQFLYEKGYDQDQVVRVDYYGAECEAGAEDASTHGSHDTWFAEGEEYSEEIAQDMSYGHADGYDENGCDALAHNRWTNIRHLAYHVMWYIYDHYSSQGQPVDVVAHSMGGLVMRYGLAHTGYNVFPDELLVEDVATVGTPHDDPHGLVCAASQASESPSGWIIDWLTDSVDLPYTFQIEQMCSDTDYDLQWWNDEYGQNPQGTDGTDWSLIGSFEDEVVPEESHVDMDAHCKYVYEDPDYGHTDYLSDTSRQDDAILRVNDEPTGNANWECDPDVDTLGDGVRLTGMPKAAELAYKAVTSSNW